MQWLSVSACRRARHLRAARPALRPPREGRRADGAACRRVHALVDQDQGPHHLQAGPRDVPRGRLRLLMGAVAGQRNHQDSSESRRQSGTVIDAVRWIASVRTADRDPSATSTTSTSKTASRRCDRSWTSTRSGRAPHLSRARRWALQWQIVRDLNEEGIRSQRGGKFFQARRRSSALAALRRSVPLSRADCPGRPERPGHHRRRDVGERAAAVECQRQSQRQRSWP